MQFLNPKILWHLIWLVPVLFIIYKYAQATRSRAISLLFGPNYNAKNIHTLSTTSRLFRYILFFISIIFIFLTLARPVWGKKIIPITASGRDIIIVCDVSKSMLATDIAPSRLDHAKFLIKELVHQFPNDRFALVAFAGTAFLQCPLTVDKVSFMQMLDELKPELIPVGGTNLQTALEYALKAFGAAESSHRAIVLISDGDENYGNVEQILDELKKSNIPIFAIGIGNPLQSTPISIRDEKGNTSFLRDSQGNIATTKLNESVLQSLATSTNGIYIRSTATNTGIELLSPRIKALIPEKFASFENTRPIERFQLPLAVAILFLLIRLAISERRKIPLVLTLLCACINVALADDTDLPLPEQNENIISSQSQKAKIPAEDKIPPHEIFNKALQLHKQNSYEDAQTLYQNAASHQSATPEIRKKSLQNLGAIFHQQGRDVLSQNPQEALKKFSLAEKLYIEALRENFPNSDLAQNQQILLNDIKIAQQIIQQQQKLQEAKQKAKEELQKAADKNNEAKQNPNDQQKSKEAQQQTQKAQEELQNYQQKLNEQQNKQEQELQNTQTALDEVQNALNEQQKNNFEKAQEHLNNALQQFKEEKQESSKEENKPQQEEQKENQENKTPQQTTTQPRENKEQNIDPEQAEALLQLMADDEKELREKLLQERLQKSKIKPVEKDW